jgi:hypothetical protein
MAKNILIVVLALLSVMSFTYAHYQRTLTERALVLAEANASQARMAEREAMAQRQLAEEQAALALEQLKRADMARLQAEALLKSKKK